MQRLIEFIQIFSVVSKINTDKDDKDSVRTTDNIIA